MDPRVHRLTDLLGAVVVDGTGRRIGRVADLTLRLGHGDATVDRLLVRRSGATTTLPWTAVRRVDVRRIGVGTPGEPAVEALRRTDEPLRPDEALASDELLLGQLLSLVPLLVGGRTVRELRGILVVVDAEVIAQIRAGFDQARVPVVVRSQAGAGAAAKQQRD